MLPDPRRAFVSEAVHRLAAERRAEIEQGVRAATALLDGTLRADVSVLSGFSGEEPEELGGVEG